MYYLLKLKSDSIIRSEFGLLNWKIGPFEPILRVLKLFLPEISLFTKIKADRGE